MTLTKPKPKRPTAAHRKRLGQHHHRGPHYLKTYWPYIPILTILTCSFVLNSWLSQLHKSVLGYATDMSISSLISDTNSQRTQNGESTLSLNDALSAAAQAKANDMAARDYWSHDTPDGKTPWSFITAAGYEYTTAGENLAYGFTTAADTITGWMNSPEHRANILNTTFINVGFGIADAQNYQESGPETIVVAMYASPAVAVVSHPAPITPPPATVHETGTLSKTPVVSPVATPPKAVTVPAPSPAPISTEQVKSADVRQPSPVSVVQSPTERIDRLQLTAADISWSVFTVTSLGLICIVFLVLRHSLAWRRVFIHDAQFVLHHPMMDVLVVSCLAVCIILTRTVGVIR